jgi:NTE family protein
VLADTLSTRLYRRTSVAELPGGPQIILTSTDLATGRAFRVSREFIGSYEFGYIEPAPRSLTLGVAVAASAAVPLLFPPVLVNTDALGITDAPPRLSLVDGGVYDNQGLEWFQGWSSGRPATAVECNFIVVVNASGRLQRTTHTYGALRGALRSRQIQYAQTVNLRTRWFVEQLITGRREGAYVGIARDPRRYLMPDETTAIDPRLYDGALPSALVGPLAGLRTDLDRFAEVEAALLSYHGYWSLHARLASLHPNLSVTTPAWREFADISEAETAELAKALVTGRRRLRLRR